MLDDIVLDPRLAFVLILALLIGAAIPLAIAWAKLVPEEKPPFGSLQASETDQSAETNSAGRSKSTRDPFAVVLLIFVTLSFISRFPGVRYDFSSHALPLSFTNLGSNVRSWFVVDFSLPFQSSPQRIPSFAGTRLEFR